MPRWTSEARQRQRELIQNWQPWQQSTGAITPEGKAKSAQNALKHGFRSKEHQEFCKALTQMKRSQSNLLSEILKNLDNSF